VSATGAGERASRPAHNQGKDGAPVAPQPTRSLTRVERQAATRAALLRSASRSICEHGMDGASIDRIAAEAGYTKGAFYANFASKEDMFLAILDAKFADEMERLEAAMSGAGDPAEEARQAAEEFLTYVDRDPEWPRLYQEFATHAARNEEFRAELAARQRALRERMAAIFARWSATLGVESVLPHADVAAMTFAMANGFLLDRIIDPELDNGLYATMCEVFLLGLAAMAEGKDSPAPIPTRGDPLGTDTVAARA
jgi:AcrR family transcriptional regulator